MATETLENIAITGFPKKISPRDAANYLVLELNGRNQQATRLELGREQSLAKKIEDSVLSGEKGRLSYVVVEHMLGYGKWPDLCRMPRHDKVEGEISLGSHEYSFKGHVFHYRAPVLYIDQIEMLH
jgi:hypothetical protein